MMEILKQLFSRKAEPIKLPEINDWQLISKTYAPPRRDISIEKLDAETVQKVMLGVTTLLWECQNTGKVRTEELLGTDEIQLDELMRKVNQFGPQYVKGDDGSTYVLNKYVPLIADPMNLPMR